MKLFVSSLLLFRITNPSPFRLKLCNILIPTPYQFCNVFSCRHGFCNLFSKQPPRTHKKYVDQNWNVCVTIGYKIVFNFVIVVFLGLAADEEFSICSCRTNQNEMLQIVYHRPWPSTCTPTPRHIERCQTLFMEHCLDFIC